MKNKGKFHKMLISRFLHMVIHNNNHNNSTHFAEKKAGNILCELPCNSHKMFQHPEYVN